MSAAIVDDKSPHCIPFILHRLSLHRCSPRNAQRPFFVGLNGVQGAGKTTLVEKLQHTLKHREGLETLVLSIDDLYLTHADQLKLASSNPLNPLLQHRGEPGTHDIALARTVFSALQAGKKVAIPSYDKSKHHGRGDRAAASAWKTVNASAEKTVRVIIVEGWCVGFRALPREDVARLHGEKEGLKRHRLEDLLFVNAALAEYDVVNDCFDAFIHIDAEKTRFVYEWREEQEMKLRLKTGGNGGMSKEEVVEFVDGYYPAYELFTDALRKGVFQHDQSKQGAQLRLIVGRDRKVKRVVEI